MKNSREVPKRPLHVPEGTKTEPKKVSSFRATQAQMAYWQETAEKLGVKDFSAFLRGALDSAVFISLRAKDPKWQEFMNAVQPLAHQILGHGFYDGGAKDFEASGTESTGISMKETLEKFKAGQLTEDTVENRESEKALGLSDQIKYAYEMPADPIAAIPEEVEGEEHLIRFQTHGVQHPGLANVQGTFRAMGEPIDQVVLSHGQHFHGVGRQEGSGYVVLDTSDGQVVYLLQQLENVIRPGEKTKTQLHPGKPRL